MFMKILIFILLVQTLVADPLPSWNEGPNKAALLKFVEEAENIPRADRIAVFDQDGTLWIEKPFYTQLEYAFQNIKDSSTINPTKLTEGEIARIIAETHAGMTIQEFDRRVAEWLKRAVHPRFKKPYTDLVYQPMLEVIRLLEHHGFTNYIVSGGGQEFMRVYSDSTYKIPVNQVIGTAGKVKYEFTNGSPSILKEPEILFINDKEGKVEGINLIIGKRPLIAFGNSDGDKEMLEWTTHQKFLVHHDDAEREYAYDKDSKIGTFSEDLMKEADKLNWHVISMKKDWNVIFPYRLNN